MTTGISSMGVLSDTDFCINSGMWLWAALVLFIGFNGEFAFSRWDPVVGGSSERPNLSSTLANPKEKPN